MTWAPQELLKTLFEIFSNDTVAPGNLQSLGVTGFFDSTAVPQGQAFPYITFADQPFEDRSNHTHRGWQASFVIHVWYREPGRGRKKVQEIQKRIDELLHTVDICVDGWNIISLRQIAVDVIVDSDNVTLHGTQIFNLMLGES